MMVAASPEPSGNRIVEATRLFSAGDRAGAERAYRDIQTPPPRHAATWSNLAALGIALGDIAGAGRHALQAVRLQPSSAEANNNLGVAFWRSGQPQAAEAALRRAIQARPAQDTAWHNLALVLSASGHERAALDLLDKAQAHVPKSWKTALLQAELARTLGEAGQARAHVLRGLSNLLPTLDLAMPATGPATATPSDDAPVRQALFAAVDVLDAAGHRDWYLMGATLLAIHRDGRLFPHDKDVDLAILDASDPGAVRRVFEGHPEFTVIPNRGGDDDARLPVLGLVYTPTGIGVDIFFARTVEGGIRFELGWPDRLAAQLRPHGIERRPWAGRDWGMPSPPERYLEDCYGADWRAQWRQVGDTGYDMRHSDTQVSNPSRTAESLPRAVTLALLRLARALQAANWPKAHAMCLQLLAREDIAEVVAIRAALDAAGHAPRRA